MANNMDPSYWDKYKSSHEPEAHWELRKKFLETHKNDFNEDKLICLAQVFYNVEFLGCKYPDKVMKKIEELSVGVVEEHHAEKKLKIQRTFVAASDAAESKVTRTGVKRKREDEVQCTSKEQTSGFSIRDIVSGQNDSISFTNQKIHSFMNRNPPISNLILVMMKDELSKDPSSLTFQMFQRSGQFSNLFVRLQEYQLNSTQYKYCFEVAPKENKDPHNYVSVVSIETDDTIKMKSKKKEFTIKLLEKTYKQLSQEHFTIVINNKFYSTQNSIEKKNDEMEQGIKEMEEEVEQNKINEKIKPTSPSKNGFISDSFEKIAEDNLGSKLLKLMGWSGSGGLGKNEQGRSEPVPITGRLDKKRIGLGSGEEESESLHKSLSGEGGESKFGLNVKKQTNLSNPEFKHWARDLLNEYLNSTKLLWFEDLIFSTSFTKEERAFLHTICQNTQQFRNHLQAKSYGKDENRHLVISKKLNKNGICVLYDLMHCGDNPKFSLIIPESFNTFMG